MRSRLYAVNDTDIEQLKSWLLNADSVRLWSGPAFRYPYSDVSFREDCRLDSFANFALKNGDGVMLGFGQIGERYDRSHFARLIVSPEARGVGMGKELLGALLRQAALRSDCKACGLFVYRHNHAAVNCYKSMNFVIDEYPENAKLQDECYYMTRTLA